MLHKLLRFDRAYFYFHFLPNGDIIYYNQTLEYLRITPGLHLNTLIAIIQTKQNAVFMESMYSYCKVMYIT